MTLPQIAKKLLRLDRYNAVQNVIILFIIHLNEHFTFKSKYFQQNYLKLNVQKKLQCCETIIRTQQVMTGQTIWSTRHEMSGEPVPH